MSFWEDLLTQKWQIFGFLAFASEAKDSDLGQSPLKTLNTDKILCQ